MKKNRKGMAWIITTLSILGIMTGCSSAEVKTETEPHSIVETLPPAESSTNKTDIVSQTQSGELKIHFIDVGQGDSILIQSGDYDMLVDAGENDKGDTVVTYLHSQGISTLDYVIGTHPHSDHIGGLDDVINNFSIDKVILPSVEHTTKTYEDVLNAIGSQGLKVTKPIAGDTYQLGDASFQIIAPNGNYGDELNDWSVGIKVTNGDTSFVMSGDAESQAESDICNNGLDISANVLKLGHHGSRTSTSGAFLNKVNPQAVVISCGMGNSYGHPHQETMTKLSAKGVQIYRTDEQGTVIATSDGKNITWSTQPSASKSAGVAKETTKETTKAADKPNNVVQAKGITYVLNTKSKKFHKGSCGSLPTDNRSDTDMSRDEVIAAGYEPCKRCNP